MQGKMPQADVESSESSYLLSARKRTTGLGTNVWAVLKYTMLSYDVNNTVVNMRHVVVRCPTPCSLLVLSRSKAVMGVGCTVRR